MFDTIIDSFNQYFGLDWMAFLFGMSGTYLLTCRNHWGFLLSTLACFCGLSVAVISTQYGFILYNSVLIIMMVKGFITWQQAEETDKSVSTRQVEQPQASK